MKIITSKVRFSYVHVFEPQAIDENSKPKYSVSIIVSKKDKKLIKKLEKAVQDVVSTSKSKWGGKVPSNLKTPLRDGDEERSDDEAYENSIFFAASSTNRPGVVDEDLNDIIDSEDFYSGCYGRVSINFYAFNTSGNKGIAVGLNNIQKLEDGENLTGRTSAQDDFGTEDDDDLM